jgi:hypothetical protein
MTIYGNRKDPYLPDSPPERKPMRVIMFQPRFAAKVKDGSKRQTIRPIPKREIKPGMILSLRQWSGTPYRSKQIILREDSCLSTEAIEIKEAGGNAFYMNMDAFALADGFDCWENMKDWFRKTHGLPFRGLLIKW